jgi:hypothetical protein
VNIAHLAELLPIYIILAEVYQNKKALPSGDRGSARGNLSILESMVLAVFTFAGINSGFNNTVGDAEAEYGQCVPQPPMKHHMSCVPDPFKVKRKHAFPP